MGTCTIQHRVLFWTDRRLMNTQGNLIRTTDLPLSDVQLNLGKHRFTTQLSALESWWHSDSSVARASKLGYQQRGCVGPALRATTVIGNGACNNQRTHEVSKVQ